MSHPEVIEKNKRVKMRAIVVMALIMCMTTVSYGALIVYDPTVDTTLKVKFVETIRQLITEYYQHVAFHDYWKVIHGNWKDPLQIAEVAETSLATLGIDIKLVGYAKNDRFRKEKATQITADALDDLQRILIAKSDKTGLSKVRENIEEIYGDVPVTRGGAAVEATYRDMAATVAFTGQANESIKELLTAADKIKEEVESGRLTPGDLERYQVIEADLRLRAQLLQTQAMNHHSRLMVNMAGIQAAQEGRYEKSRLKDRHQRLELMSMAMFSPKQKKEETK